MKFLREKPSSPLNDIAGRFTPYLYLAPSVILIAMFLIYPLYNTFRYSFFKWDGLGQMNFIAITNYLRLLNDRRFLSAFTANLIYILLFSLVPTVLGLIIASIIGRAQVQGVRYFRTIFFTPQVIASVAIGTIFGWIYAPQFGVVNQILEIVGLRTLQRAWLGSTETAPFAVGLIGTWLWTGFCVIIFIAGIKKINNYLYDAAQIDGANALKQFFHVTLPTVLCSLLFAIMSAYALAFMDLPCKHILTLVTTVLGVMIAAEFIMIPLYRLMNELGLIDTYWAVILPQLAMSAAFSTLVIRSFFLGLPKELIDAALVDGACSWHILWRILVPIAKPAIVTSMALTTVWTWNSYVLPLVLLHSPRKVPLPVGLILFRGTYTVDIPLTMTGTVITALPMILFYFFFQRHIIRGLTQGAVD